MKKVLIITYYWPPSGGAGVQRWVKFVKYFRLYGIEPIVLTVDSDYASYAIIDTSLTKDVLEDIKVFKTKSIEPFRLYKKLNKKKEIPYGGFVNEHNPNFIQKISRFVRGNLFIPDARIGWNRYAYSKAVKLIKEYNIKTIITTSPPHSTQLIGLKLKKQFGLYWIADLRDPWIDIYYYKQLYHSFLAKKIDSRLEVEVLKKTDKIVVVSKSIKKLFASKIKPEISNKIHVIPNGFDAEDFKDQGKLNGKEFVITYTGTLAENYHIETFLDAFESFLSKLDRPKIKLEFVGKVSLNYKALIENSEFAKHCSFIPYVEHSVSLGFLLQSTSLLLVIPDMPLNEGILTGKLFEYLAAKKPIIGIGPINGDAASIINECNAGRMFSYDNKNGIIKYLDILYTNWLNSRKENFNSKQINKYSRERLTEKLAMLIP